MARLGDCSYQGAIPSISLQKDLAALAGTVQDDESIGSAYQEGARDITTFNLWHHTHSSQQKSGKLYGPSVSQVENLSFDHQYRKSSHNICDILLHIHQYHY